MPNLQGHIIQGQAQTAGGGFQLKLHLPLPRQETVAYIKHPWIAFKLFFEIIRGSQEHFVVVQREMNLYGIAGIEQLAVKSNRFSIRDDTHLFTPKIC